MLSPEVIGALIAVDAPSLTLGAIGLISALASAVFVVLGARTRILSDQQAKTIDALTAYKEVLEAKIAERDAQIERFQRQVDGLQNQVSILGNQITAGPAIQELGQKLDAHTQAILTAVGGGRPALPPSGS